MHVGVEEAVAEHLGEEDLHAGARERRDVDALCSQHLLICEIGVPCMRSITITRCAHRSQYTSGTSSSGEPREIAPQLARVGRLAQQVQLVVEVALELGHHLARLQPPAVAPAALDQAGGGVEQRQVAARSPARRPGAAP